MVLSLKKTEPRVERNHVVCCLRNDGESYITGAQRKAIITQIRKDFDNVILRDTVDVSVDECTEALFEETLHNFWGMLRSSKVVVTDRLHCMIFCAITGTPVVVIDNTNKKISGVIKEWLSDVPWIIMMEKFDCDKIIENARYLYDNVSNTSAPDLDEKFKPLKNACK